MTIHNLVEAYCKIKYEVDNTSEAEFDKVKASVLNTG